MISSLMVLSVSVSRHGRLVIGPTIRSISQCPSSSRFSMLFGLSSMLGRSLCAFLGACFFFRGFLRSFSHKSEFLSCGNLPWSM